MFEMYYISNIQSIRPRTAASPSIQSVSHITSLHGDNPKKGCSNDVHVTARLAHTGSEVITCKRLHMARFRGRDITSFRPADVHLGAYFKYTVDKTPYGGFA